MTELLEIPVFGIAGKLRDSYVPALTALITGMGQFGCSCFVLDISKLELDQKQDSGLLLELVDSVPEKIKVHMVCSGTPRNVLKGANLGKNVRLYLSTDELARLLQIEWNRQESQIKPEHPEHEEPLSALQYSDLPAEHQKMQTSLPPCPQPLP